jgi:AAA domain
MGKITTSGFAETNGGVPFCEVTVTHRFLDQTHRSIMRTVRQPAGFTFLLVYGPTGVGKTRMIASLEQEILAMVSPLPVSACRVLTISADPPDGSPFNRGYFYQTLLTRLGEKTYPLQVQIASHADHSPLKRRRLPKAAINSNDIPELREATKEAIPRHGLSVLIIDEAHHMLYAGDGAQGSILQEQLAWLKSLSIAAPNLLYILVGTYDLLNFGRLNGELSRRCQPIHFPRYQLQRQEDCVEFQAALFHLLQKVPLGVDAATLVQHYWLYFYERSVGCIGILKDWLSRAVSTALDERKDILTLDWVQDHALEVEQCQQMMLDAFEGEQKLNYTEAHREHLWRLLQGGELIAPVPPLPPRRTLPSEPKPTVDTQNVPLPVEQAALLPRLHVKKPLPCQSKRPEHERSRRRIHQMKRFRQKQEKHQQLIHPNGDERNPQKPLRKRLKQTERCHRRLTGKQH